GAEGRGLPRGPPEGRRLLADDPPRPPGRQADDEPGAHHLFRHHVGDARPAALRAAVGSPGLENSSPLGSRKEWSARLTCTSAGRQGSRITRKPTWSHGSDL